VKRKSPGSKERRAFFLVRAGGARASLTAIRRLVAGHRGVASRQRKSRRIQRDGLHQHVVTWPVASDRESVLDVSDEDISELKGEEDCVLSAADLQGRRLEMLPASLSLR